MKECESLFALTERSRLPEMVFEPPSIDCERLTVHVTWIVSSLVSVSSDMDLGAENVSWLNVDDGLIEVVAVEERDAMSSDTDGVRDDDSDEDEDFVAESAAKDVDGVMLND